MSGKQRILPKWVALPKLHAGWTFEGSYRVPQTVIDWVHGADWPEFLPLTLEVDSAGRSQLALNLRIDAKAQLPCQRCGVLLDWNEQLEQQLLLVTAEDPKKDVAQWVVHDERVELEELIAQEISLALPDFPRHDSCHLQESMQAN